MDEGHIRKPSIAKSIVATQKARDAQGHFVSEEEKQVVLAQRQQAQFIAEKERMNAMLGKQSNSQPINTQQINNSNQTINQPSFQQQPQSNFQAILNANKPGSTEDTDRWNVLLGKKKNTNNNSRW